MSKTTVLTDVGGLAALRAAKTKRVLLAGDTVFAQLKPEAPTGFTLQIPRDAAFGFLTQFSKHTPKAYVAVDDRLLTSPEMRFAVAFDGYLHWGLRQKSLTVLFGGGESPSNVTVQTMVFDNNRLLAIKEKNLPEISSTDFQATLRAMLEEMRLAYPTAKFVQAAPLTSWATPGVEFIGEKALKGLTYLPLSRTVSFRASYLVPGLIAVLGLLSYPTMAMMGWAKYSDAVTQYDNAISDPTISSKEGMDTDYLTIMNARRLYMEQPRRQTALAQKSAAIVTGIATVPNIQIIDMTLPAPVVTSKVPTGFVVSPDAGKQLGQIGTDRPADMRVMISTPKSKEVAFVQAKEVMTKIANATGMSLRLVHNGWRDDGVRRTFDIEGFVHD